MKSRRRGTNLLTRYPQLIAECLARHVDVKRSALAGPVYIASQFSGMATAELAAEKACKACRAHLGLANSRAVVSSACENHQPTMRALLKDLPDTACIFPDITDFVKPARRSVSPRVDEWVRQCRPHALLRALAARRLQKKVHCARHARACPLATALRGLLVAGTPCTDWSAIGAHGGLLGETFEPFMSWPGSK